MRASGSVLAHELKFGVQVQSSVLGFIPDEGLPLHSETVCLSARSAHTTLRGKQKGSPVHPFPEEFLREPLERSLERMRWSKIQKEALEGSLAEPSVDLLQRPLRNPWSSFLWPFWEPYAVEPSW